MRSVIKVPVVLFILFFSTACNKEDQYETLFKKQDKKLEVKNLVVSPMPADSLQLDSLEKKNLCR
jgi:hypothetical protein